MISGTDAIGWLEISAEPTGRQDARRLLRLSAPGGRVVVAVLTGPSRLLRPWRRRRRLVARRRKRVLRRTNEPDGHHRRRRKLVRRVATDRARARAFLVRARLRLILRWRLMLHPRRIVRVRRWLLRGIARLRRHVGVGLGRRRIGHVAAGRGRRSRCGLLASADARGRRLLVQVDAPVRALSGVAARSASSA